MQKLSYPPATEFCPSLSQNGRKLRPLPPVDAPDMHVALQTVDYFVDCLVSDCWTCPGAAVCGQFDAVAGDVAESRDDVWVDEADGLVGRRQRLEERHVVVGQLFEPVELGEQTAVSDHVVLTSQRRRHPVECRQHVLL